MLTPQRNPGDNTAAAGNGGQMRPPAISLPKGGGAIRGIGEKFATNPVTGTGSMTVPIATSPGRSGFGPQLSLSYDSGAGNGPFGFGWSLSLPSITHKTDKGLPKYQDVEESDVFILSGAEDLVPILEKKVTHGNEKQYRHAQWTARRTASNVIDHGLKACEARQKNRPYQLWEAQITPEMVADFQPLFDGKAVCSVKPHRATAFGAARHWRFAGGALTPLLTKGTLSPLETLGSGGSRSLRIPAKGVDSPSLLAVGLSRGLM